MNLEKLVRITRPDRSGRIRITGRKIYILPTRYGLVFGILLILLLIASINYANNPAFLLTFLLAGIFFQAIFHTWRNLKGLELQWIHAVTYGISTWIPENPGGSCPPRRERPEPLARYSLVTLQNAQTRTDKWKNNWIPSARTQWKAVFTCWRRRLRSIHRKKS